MSFGLFLFICRECENPVTILASSPFHEKLVKIDLDVDPAYDHYARKIDHFFSKRHSWQQFNGNILFALDGKVVIKKSYGYSDFREKKPLELASRFQLASVSKQFTAFGMLMLHERGLLSLEDTVNRFFPEFPYPDITIRLLLTHLSGLPNYTYFMEKYWPNSDSAMCNQDVLNKMIEHQPPRYFYPNRKFDYSNTGYLVLAAIIEHVTGASYKEFMEDEVFKPLGMRHTKVFCKNSSPIRNRVAGYHLNRVKIHDNFLDGVTGDKGIYSTVEDMFIWDQRLHSNHLVSDSLLHEAMQPQSRWKGNKNYGYGWRILRLKDGRLIPYHYGWWHGFRSYMIHIPERNASIIILNNSIKGTFYKVTELLDLVDLQ